MANEHKIEVNKRKEGKKQSLKKVRRDGNIPGIYYSPSSKNSTPILITSQEYNLALKSGARIFNISVGGKKQNVLFKSVQYHPVTEQVLHIDLYGIDMNKPINIKVPIQLVGTPIGVSEEGGVLNQPTNELEIQCLPSDIPDFIEMDISGLNLGNSMNAGSIELQEKFELISSEELVLVSVTHAQKEVEPTPESEGDELFLDEDGESSGDDMAEKESSPESETKSDTE